MARFRLALYQLLTLYLFCLLANHFAFPAMATPSRTTVKLLPSFQGGRNLIASVASHENSVLSKMLPNQNRESVNWVKIRNYLHY